MERREKRKHKRKKKKENEVMRGRERKETRREG